MALTTDFTPGRPNWIDLGVNADDMSAAAAFYGSVFGWDFMSAGPEAGGYGFFNLGSKTVGGVGPLMEPGARPSWQLFFYSDDVDGLGKTVEQHGGTVRVPPMDVMTAGRMGGFTDPAGAKFNAWQGRDVKGVDVLNEVNSMVWTQLATNDQEGAKTFYGAVFGWASQDMPMGEGATYTVVGPAPAEESTSQGGIMTITPEMAAMGVKPFWEPYFEVADCDATAAKITEKGGMLPMGPATMEGIGRMAACVDPFGAAFSIITSEQPAS